MNKFDYSKMVEMNNHERDEAICEVIHNSLKRICYEYKVSYGQLIGCLSIVEHEIQENRLYLKDEDDGGGDDGKEP
jgi:hypothetical protein